MLPTFTSCQSTVFTTQVSPSWALLLSNVLLFAQSMLENPVKLYIYPAPHFAALAFENVDELSLNSFLLLWPWLTSAPALPVGLECSRLNIAPMVLKSLPARHRKIADINKGRKNITQILDFTKNGDINRPENETAATKRGAMVRQDGAFGVDYRPGSIRGRKNVGR